MTTAEKLIRKDGMRGKAKWMAEGKMERDFKIVKKRYTIRYVKRRNCAVDEAIVRRDRQDCTGYRL